MEEGLSLSKMMEAVKLFYIVTFSSILFQAATCITDTNLSQLSINGMDYTNLQTNKSSYLSLIGQPIHKAECENFMRGYQIIFPARKILKQPEKLRTRRLKTITYQTQNEHNYIVRRYYDTGMRKKQREQWINRIQPNRQRKESSYKIVREMLNWSRLPENKKVSLQLTSSHRIRDNRRDIKVSLSRTTASILRTSSQRNSRPLMWARDVEREIRDIRKASRDETNVRFIRKPEGLLYNKRSADGGAVNRFLRLVGEYYHEKRSKSQIRLHERLDHRMQLSVSVGRHNQERNSINPAQRHDKSRSNLMTERALETRNTDTLLYRRQFQLLERRSILNMHTKQSRVVRKTRHAARKSLVSDRQSLNFGILNEKRSTELGTRRCEKLLEIVPLKTSREIEINSNQFSRKVVKSTRRRDYVQRLQEPDVRMVSERNGKIFTQRRQDKIVIKDRVVRSNIMRHVRNLRETSLNEIVRKEVPKLHIYAFQNLKSYLVTILNTVMSELHARGTQISVQSISLPRNINNRMPEILRRDERRVRTIEMHRESERKHVRLMKLKTISISKRQEIIRSDSIRNENTDNVKFLHPFVRSQRKARTSFHFSKSNIENTGFSRLLQCNQNNDPSSRSTVRRDVDNRLSGNALRRKIRQTAFFQKSSESSEHTNRFRRSIVREPHSRRADRFDDRKILEGITEETSVMGNIRVTRETNRRSDNTIRSKSSMARGRLFQEKSSITEHRTYGSKRHHSRTLDIPYYSRKHSRSDSRKLPQILKTPFLTNSTGLVIAQTNKELEMKSYRDVTSKRRIVQTLGTSRTEIFSIQTVQLGHCFMESNPQRQICSLSRMTSSKNGITSWKKLLSKSTLAPIIIQKPAIEKKENLINYIWNILASIPGALFQDGFDTLRWKTAHSGSSHKVHGYETEQQLSPSEDAVTKLTKSYPKQSYGILDGIIAVILTFAAVKFGSTKLMDYENHRVTYGSIGYGI